MQKAIEKSVIFILEYANILLLNLPALFCARYLRENAMNDKNENDKPEQNNQEKSDKSTIENLVHITEKHATANSSDLNNRLQEIESELRHLNAREAATNKAFRELLSDNKKQSATQNTQLAETRDLVNGIRENYKKLTQDYQRLAAGANLLSVKLEHAHSEMTTDIESLKISTHLRADELAEGQLQMIERANRIEQKSAQLAEDLDARVNVIRSTISALESKLAEEIREVAVQSEQRDEALTIRTNMLEENFSQETDRLSRADRELHEKLAKETSLLRHADEQQSESIAALQANSGRLTVLTEDLQYQANVTDSRASDLEDRSDELEQNSEKHTARLAQVNNTVDRHHKGFAMALVLIVVTLGILSVLQQNRWIQSTDKDVALKQQLETQQTSLAAQTVIQQETATRLETLENQSQQADKSLASTDEKVTETLNQLAQSINSLQEKTDNNASRMSAMSPSSTFGQDNTIHTAKWLAQQDQEHYVVRVATLGSKQDLYTLAYRWSNLLKQSNLSYIEQQQAGKTLYTLIYGTFADKTQAEQISRSLPVFNYGSRPVASKLAELM